jgi:hypothetical protein
MSSELTIVNQHLKFPTVSLIEPSSSLFIHVAAEIDAQPAFFPSSRKKKQAIARCKELCKQLQSASGIINASVFKAILIPPGQGKFIKQRLDKVHVARFDLAILIECKNHDAVELLQAHPTYKDLLHVISLSASFTHQIAACNIRRIAPVDHSRQGVFLFNYFFADSVEQNLAVWNYTAGWFQAETGLDNSTVLLPVDTAQSQYSIINHCRWDALSQILPSLILKKSFHSYVLANFLANNVAAMPILYRLA